MLHAYTRAGGRVNYMVYGLGKRNSAEKYSPLSVVQLTTDERSIRTAQLRYVPTATSTDPYKRTIALFLAEVLYHVLRHPMPDEPMYEFIEQAAQALDQTDEPQNFHLAFLVGFAAQLGFEIPKDDEPKYQILLQTPVTRAERQVQLRALCDYFEEHVETWQTPRSLDVLMEVFD